MEEEALRLETATASIELRKLPIGSYLESYKVIPKRNYYGAYG